MFVVAWFTSADVSRRLKAATGLANGEAVKQARKASLRQVLFLWLRPGRQRMEPAKAGSP